MKIIFTNGHFFYFLNNSLTNTEWWNTLYCEEVHVIRIQKVARK